MAEPFNLNTFLPFRLNRLAAEVSERLARLYSERFDLDIPQWRVLATLSAGECTAQDIVASTRTHKSTISRAVQELEDRKLIERAASAGDKRAYRLRLSTNGRKLFRLLQPIVLDYQRELLGRVRPVHGRALLQGIAALEEALGLNNGKPK
jgi:DNA-binding MarR family transcriptional regulator